MEGAKPESHIWRFSGLQGARLSKWHCAQSTLEEVSGARGATLGASLPGACVGVS